MSANSEMKDHMAGGSREALKNCPSKERRGVIAQEKPTHSLLLLLCMVVYPGTVLSSPVPALAILLRGVNASEEDTQEFFVSDLRWHILDLTQGTAAACDGASDGASDGKDGLPDRP